MNAPLLHPVVPVADARQETRFPRLSAAQKILQAAADRAVMLQFISDLKLKPGISIPANLGGESPYENGGR